MRYGLYLSNFGAEISARLLADLARQADKAGWDGVFLWDPILHSKSQRVPLLDPWVALAAMTTCRIRLGTMLTPVARRPWKVVRTLTEPGMARLDRRGSQRPPRRPARPWMPNLTAILLTILADGRAAPAVAAAACMRPWSLRSPASGLARVTRPAMGFAWEP
jgi:hypothetical protein